MLHIEMNKIICTVLIINSLTNSVTIFAHVYSCMIKAQ